MNASEMVVVARLADHYEDRGIENPLDTADHDLRKFKHEAPALWRRLRDSGLSDRKTGDWLYKFIVRWSRSGVSFKNFAADELERSEL